MLVRLLIFLAFVFLAWSRFRRSRADAAERTMSDARATAASRTLGQPEAMIHCERCGLHLPASEAVRDDAGRAYCGASHRAMGPR